VGFGDRIEVKNDSNLLPVGLSQGLGDTVTVTAATTSSGIQLTNTPEKGCVGGFIDDSAVW